MFFYYWLSNLHFVKQYEDSLHHIESAVLKRQRVWIGSMRECHPGKMLYSKMVSIPWTPHMPLRTTGLATIVPSDPRLPRDSHISGPKWTDHPQDLEGSAKLTVNVTVPLEKPFCFLRPQPPSWMEAWGPWDMWWYLIRLSLRCQGGEQWARGLGQFPVEGNYTSIYACGSHI